MSQQPVRLIKTLSMWQVVVMGLAYLTPMAVFDTFAIVGDITEGRVATAYLLALGGILLTAFSYGHLVLTLTSTRWRPVRRRRTGRSAWSRQKAPLRPAA